MFVTVTNDSGMALNEVTVTIVPMGRTTLYTEYVGRMESADSRKIMLGDFNGRDGTPFSLRVVKPKAVQVKGTDVAGKAREVEVAWKYPGRVRFAGLSAAPCLSPPPASCSRPPGRPHRGPARGSPRPLRRRISPCLSTMPPSKRRCRSR
jgi:hypothetical protein